MRTDATLGRVEHLELTVFGLLVGIAALAVLANVIRVPYPITLVLGGLAIGMVPGMPTVELEPDIVLLIFLPPLLYGAAFFTSLRDLRANARPIALLAIGLVFVTMFAVATVAHVVIGLGWAESFVLGAIVSPTDAVAPAEIMRRLGAPRRLLTVVEGENLTNDWTALVLYSVAVAAVVSGHVLPGRGDGSLRAQRSRWPGGRACGGRGDPFRAIAHRRSAHRDHDLAAVRLRGLSPSRELGFSGVIAAVTVGVYMGWYTPQLTTAVMRLQGISVWEILTFLLNAVLFLLVGLQLPAVLDAVEGYSTAELLGWGVLVSAVVIAVRLIWGFTVTYVIRALDRRPSQRERRASVRERLVVGWAGMRGSVSLAAALAIPLHVDGRWRLPRP